MLTIFTTFAIKMKHKIFVFSLLLVFVALIIFSCGNKFSSSKFAVPKSDSITKADSIETLLSAQQKMLDSLNRIGATNSSNLD